MAVKSNIKTMQGHIRPYKANTAIQYHNVPQKHFFCSLAHFLFHLEHMFRSFFHAKKSNKASFRTFKRCSRSKSK